MRRHAKPLVLLSFLVAAGCSHAARPQEASAPAPPLPAVPAPGVLLAPSTDLRTMTEGLAPIPGHPPVTVSGVVKRVDQATGIVTFEDGRMVQLTASSTVQKTVGSPRLEPGELVVVRDALPIGISSQGRVKPIRMATVEAVDPLNRVVRLTDGRTVQVAPSAHVHLGIDGASIELAAIRPGDELAVVPAGGAMTSGQGTAGTAAEPSALPRQAVSPATLEASELMVFRGTGGLAPR